MRALRPVLRELLTADRDDAAELVNALLADAQALPQLRRHDGLDWHIHAVPSDAPLDRRVAVEVAMAMIDVIRADELSRLSVCTDDRCEGLVLDLSRNRSRRYCSTTCANRNAVAAYRARGRRHLSRQAASGQAERRAARHAPGRADATQRDALERPRKEIPETHAWPSSPLREMCVTRRRPFAETCSLRGVLGCVAQRIDLVSGSVTTRHTASGRSRSNARK